MSLLIALTAKADAVLQRVRSVRRGPLTFTIDGGCCEGTAPHLYEHYVVPSGLGPVAELGGVPVYLQGAMAGVLEGQVFEVDVVEDAGAEAMSAETEFGVRFVLRTVLPVVE